MSRLLLLSRGNTHVRDVIDAPFFIVLRGKCRRISERSISIRAPNIWIYVTVVLYISQKFLIVSKLVEESGTEENEQLSEC
jgi:hypothetical protein